MAGRCHAPPACCALILPGRALDFGWLWPGWHYFARWACLRSSAKLARVIMGRKKVSAEAEAEYAAERRARREVRRTARAGARRQQDFRKAQAGAMPADQLYPLARNLDTALTEVMRAAYAAERAEIGPYGYDDRIHRRKARAKPAVHAWTDEAERLLTSGRPTGLPACPRRRALASPAGALAGRLPPDCTAPLPPPAPDGALSPSGAGRAPKIWALPQAAFSRS